MNRRPALSAPLALSLVLAGATGPSCQTYNDRVRAPVRAFENGNFERAEALFAGGSVDSPFLESAEAGMSAMVGGNFEAALEHLHRAEAAARDAEDRAVLGGEALVESLLTLAINESQATYEGEGYERVMLHAALGLCYLTRGNPDSVLVEARRVDELLTSEERLYETEYRAGGIGHLLSALAYELMGQPGEAYIDYVRMHEKGIGGELVRSALVRLARGLGRAEDLDRWLAEFGAGESPPPDWPSVVLVAGVGMGPAKREIRIDVPVKGGVFSWAVPRFDEGSSPTASLDLVFNGGDARIRASTVEDVAVVAARNLEDRIAWLAVRSAARGLLKREIADNLKKNDDTEWIGYAADIFTIATERADLRAWRTLPQRWVAARAFVPPGEAFTLEIEADDGRPVALGTFRLERGESMFVLGRALRSGLTAHVVGGERVDPSAASTDPPSVPAESIPAESIPNETAPAGAAP